MLPFKSPLFNIFKNKTNPKINIQTITIIYKKENGIKLNRSTRRDITWHSNMELIPNMINLLKKMTIEIEVVFNKKFIPEASCNRKKLAFSCVFNQFVLEIKHISSPNSRYSPHT